MLRVITQSILWIIVFFALNSCAHSLEITNLNDYFTPLSSSLKEPIILGITSISVDHVQNSKYINAIVDGLQRSGSFARVIYSYNDSVHRDQVGVVVDISVSPNYSGRTSNFFVNFPGFLIWAPAIFGYGYIAEVETVANIEHLKDSSLQQISIPTKYYFRQAEIDRTWTELSWLEFGAIAFIGGIVFTQYDPDVTNEFIRKVATDYGTFVANKIIAAL